MSPYQTACTGLDALAQAVESYWSTNSTRKSRRWSLMAIKLILKNLYVSVHSPTAKSRKKMSAAAFLSGKALNIAKSTAPHAFSYYLTSRFGLPHGHAVGVLLGPIFYLNSNTMEDNVNDARGATFVNKKIFRLMEIFAIPHREKIITWFKAYLQSLGIEANLNTLGLSDPHELNCFFQSVNLERLKNNPRKLIRNSIEELFCNAT